ncbi:MAG: hypothetical protein QOE70_2113 [Chthoniobacter sp.]|jgi:hypothetical protein|nr:hypothetical protein [Chthoniobacter sp.]
MKFPGIVKTRGEALAVIAQAFDLPAPHEQPRDTLGITKLRMSQETTMREFMEWLMSGPKIYKRARFDLTYTAVDRFARNLTHLHHAFSTAWTREQAPDGIRRLRESA